MRGPFFRASSSPVLTTGQLAFHTASNPVSAHPHFQQALLRPQPALTSCPRREPGGAGPKGRELRLVPSQAAGCCAASMQGTGTGTLLTAGTRTRQTTQTAGMQRGASCHTQAGIVGRGWGVGQQLEAAAADMLDPMGAPKEPSVGSPVAVGHGGRGSPPARQRAPRLALPSQHPLVLICLLPGQNLGLWPWRMGLFENTTHEYLGTCY